MAWFDPGDDSDCGVYFNPYDEVRPRVPPLTRADHFAA
jgi:hypothetical protein